MAGIAQNGQKCLIFIVVPLLRLENIKERWKKLERYIQSIMFHGEGPTNEIAFCPMFVLRKGILSFANLFLVSTLQCGANSKISFR